MASETCSSLKIPCVKHIKSIHEVITLESYLTLFSRQTLTRGRFADTHGRFERTHGSSRCVVVVSSCRAVAVSSSH